MAQAAIALEKAHRHSSLFLLPVWRTLGRGVEQLRGRRLVMAGAIVSALIVAIVVLICVPWGVNGRPGPIHPLIGPTGGKTSAAPGGRYRRG